MIIADFPTGFLCLFVCDWGAEFNVELFDNPVCKHIMGTLHSIVFDYSIFIETDGDRDTHSADTVLDIRGFNHVDHKIRGI